MHAKLASERVGRVPGCYGVERPHRAGGIGLFEQAARSTEPLLTRARSRDLRARRHGEGGRRRVLDQAAHEALPAEGETRREHGEGEAPAPDENAARPGPARGLAHDHRSTLWPACRLRRPYGAGAGIEAIEEGHGPVLVPADADDVFEVSQRALALARRGQTARLFHARLEPAVELGVDGPGFFQSLACFSAARILEEDPAEDVGGLPRLAHFEEILRLGEQCEDPVFSIGRQQFPSNSLETQPIMGKAPARFKVKVAFRRGAWY